MKCIINFLSPPGQARRSGARGGKATARNRQQRLQDAAAEVLNCEATITVPLAWETTAAAIALLDAQ